MHARQARKKFLIICHHDRQDKTGSRFSFSLSSLSIAIFSYSSFFMKLVTNCLACLPIPKCSAVFVAGQSMADEPPNSSTEPCQGQKRKTAKLQTGEISFSSLRSLLSTNSWAQERKGFSRKSKISLGEWIFATPTETKIYRLTFLNYLRLPQLHGGERTLHFQADKGKITMPIHILEIRAQSSCDIRNVNCHQTRERANAKQRQ